MIKRKWSMAWLLLAGLLLGTPALQAADDEAPPGQTYVVLVGINKYQDPQIKTRLHAEADAQALYDLFTSKGHLGVPLNHIKLLLGSADAKRLSAKATRANILEAVAWLQKNVKANDLVIFGYFGEGAPLGERSCLLRARFNREESRQGCRRRRRVGRPSRKGRQPALPGPGRRQLPRLRPRQGADARLQQQQPGARLPRQRRQPRHHAQPGRHAPQQRHEAVARPGQARHSRPR